MSFIDSLEIENSEFDRQESIGWYYGDDIFIELSTVPKIENRECNILIQTEEEYKSAKRWPHELTHDLYVRITDYRRPSSVPDYEGVGRISYTFKISKAYCFDGATIPRLAWRLIGAPSDPRFIVGALLHDVLCQHHEYVNNDRKLATIVLERCCRCTGTDSITRFLMYWFTDIYQLLFRDWYY